MSSFNGSRVVETGAAQAQDLRDRLTEREVQVLQLMCDGLTSKEIANALGIAFKTVACHRYRILDKIGADSTVAAVRWAIRIGMIQP